MKSKCLVDRLKWTFEGNMTPHAYAFGDVDNDEDNEFVIGNLKGEIALFKGISVGGQPAMTCKNLGTVGNYSFSEFDKLITCVAVGDIRNSGKNSIVCVNAEGKCHIFDIAVGSPNPTSPIGDESASPPMRPIINDKSHEIEKPNLTLGVPVNCNRILIADIGLYHTKSITISLSPTVDGDGQNEIILARTDRVSDYATEVIGGVPSKKEKSNSASSLPYLLEKKEWLFERQITSLLSATDPNTGAPLLLVGQPGGHFVIIEKNAKHTSSAISHEINLLEEVNEVSTELVKGIKWRDGKSAEVIAIITMDGLFKCYDLQSGQMSKHELKVNHKLFGLSALNLDGVIDNTQTGKIYTNQKPNVEQSDDAFVTCAWNGSTYVIDHEFNVVNFEFESRVCAFAAGKYAITPGYNVPCFMYVDFEDNIYVYFNIQINTKPMLNFGEVMRDVDINKYEELLKFYYKEYEQEIEAFSPNNPPYQPTPKLTSFFNQCLYKLDGYRKLKAKMEREIQDSIERKKVIEEKEIAEVNRRKEIEEKEIVAEINRKKEEDEEGEQEETAEFAQNDINSSSTQENKESSSSNENGNSVDELSPTIHNENDEDKEEKEGEEEEQKIEGKEKEEKKEEEGMPISGDQSKELQERRDSGFIHSRDNSIQMLVKKSNNLADNCHNKSQVSKADQQQLQQKTDEINQEINGGNSDIATVIDQPSLSMQT
ncbi:1123_t:CDS:10 [Ambispora gerdemannii]|uniref:1123_t:CDS:1 n=1 Tax=Ambispora gerdemannii TaxID=144530 RepID=A0A9N9AHD3_9GLOM|nr:1123_t:CDS:10 [Ambispora gerdemannii]